MDGNYYILLCIFLSYLTLEIQQIRILPENRFSRWCPYLRQFCLFCLDGRLFYMPLSLSCFLACLHAWCTVRHCSLGFVLDEAYISSCFDIFLRVSMAIPCWVWNFQPRLPQTLSFNLAHESQSSPLESQPAYQADQ